jgi:putative protease
MAQQKTLGQHPELLAPAGSLESFFAAVDGGADAIYTGLKDFSARAKAKNFNLKEIEQMAHFLQGQGKRLYVTLNTLIKERELPHLIDTLGALEAIGIDAIIIQDLAVWKLVRDHFPGLELHASTQLTIHNAAGVKQLERMGFTRGVLSRELTLDEIRAIRSQTTLELEHFIHGALCFSFSGQCFFSSFLGGKSGNRGRCAQPCRRMHRYRNQDGFYFSPNDLSAIELMPELTQAGICSLKIEGRMKSAEYVNKVVSAYRRVLDAAPNKRPAAVTQAKHLLKESFGRTPTKGFLSGAQPADMAIPSRKGATGRFLGEINRERNGSISLKIKEGLHIGDRVRIQPASDRSGTAFTIRQLFLGQKATTKAPAGSFVTIPSSFKNQFKVGDGVFLVSSSSGFSMSDTAARRKLERVRPPVENVSLTLSCNPDELNITAALADQISECSYKIESFPADNRGLSEEFLRQALSPTAEQPFELTEINCGDLPNIVIPPKQLKQVRRELYSELSVLRQQQRTQQRQEHLAQARESLLPLGNNTPVDHEMRLQIRDGRDQRALQDPSFDTLILPLNGPNLQGAVKLGRRAQQIIWDIPFILLERDWQEMRNAVRQLVQNGFKKFRLNNLGHFPLFDKLEDVTLYGGFRLLCLNSKSVSAQAELGINEVELYIEDDRENLSDLLNRKLPVPTAMTVYASVPLLTSRIKIKGVRSDTPILSDRGDAYRVSQRQGLTWLSSETDFSFIANLRELEEFGCHCFIVDLSHLGPFSQGGRHVIEALKRGQDPAGISKFNYERGLE